MKKDFNIKYTKKSIKVLIIFLCLMIIINIIFLYLLICSNQNKNLPFLRFKSGSLGDAFTQYDKKLGYSVPQQAILLERIPRPINSDDNTEPLFTQSKDKIERYVKEPINIIELYVYKNMPQNDFLIELYFDHPRVLSVVAETSTGDKIPAILKNHMYYIDLKPLYDKYKLNKPIKIFITSNETFFTNKFLFQLVFKPLR